ncbi:LEAF RUST 10 DISEASE-RESISTANCE LOCUS RECEPTOR-LIKE PROTEIN KINASE-like 1.2, partial [Mucuna pruriens]
MILQISFHYKKSQLCIITIIFFLATTFLSSNPKFEAHTPKAMELAYPLMKDIFYSNSLFTVVDMAVCEDKCPIPLYNYSFDQTPFTYSSENWNLSFFYNCTIDYPTYEVDCAKNATHYSFAIFHNEALEQKNYSLNEFQLMVNAPLNKNIAVNFTSLLRMNYTEILKMGFLLNWVAPYFQYCEKSGGHCGFDGNQFLCFYKDKSYLKSCGDGNDAFGNIVIDEGRGQDVPTPRERSSLDSNLYEFNSWGT